MASTIYTPKPGKNTFDLSHEVKMTGNMGNLYPCFIQDVIPGDSYKVKTQQMIRFSPLLAPMMHNIDFKLDYFFVPYRLVWSEWKDFITGGEDGNDLPSYPRFQVTSTAIANSYLAKGSLADYMGIPPIGGTTTGAWQNISASLPQEIDILKFRAYQLIYHEYFRDQNVGTEYDQYTDSGIQADSGGRLTDQLTLRKSNWAKDYFTSALPFLQRGGEVTLPLGATAPLLYGDYGDSNDNQYARRPYSVDPAGYLTSVNGNFRTDSSGIVDSPTGTGQMKIDVTNSHVVDLSNATGSTINALRKASALQQWLELMARAGSRYREQIYAIFGEKIPDYTVQIPKYLGGGKTPIMISEVLSTYSDTATAGTGSSQNRPLGDMGGHALALGDNIGFTESFDEHGVILGLCRVIPKASYTQGLNKFWQKFDKFDHYFPQFANLGEQEVYAKELYVGGTTATSGLSSDNPEGLGGGNNDETVFGYQQRYAEYKYKENQVAGDFHDTLAFWELSRRFNAAAPTLNQAFIECTPDDRIFAIQDATEDKLWMSLWHDVSAIRPIPYHSNPSLT
jgi:hypothetical protein